jgi:hypothetical protein
MNYFAHGMAYVERPYFLIGTALPDMLSVADRRVRMRTRRVEPFLDDGNPLVAELAAGVVQHLDDDRWFHSTPAFLEVNEALGGMFRDALPRDERYRPGFLGHITTELLLDGELIARTGRRIDEYYAAYERVDPAFVESTVNRMARHSTDRLAPLIPLFRREEFLKDYLDDGRLRMRLNQVMRRVKLPPLPEHIEQTLGRARTLVRDEVERLLPPERFPPAAEVFADSRH